MRTINKYLIISIGFFLIFFCQFYALETEAASLTNTSDLVSRSAISQRSSHQIKLTSPSGVSSGGTIVVTFPSGFNASFLLYTDAVITYGPTTGLENNVSIGSSPSGATWGFNVTATVVTFTSGTGTIPSGSKVIISLSNSASRGPMNPATPGNYVVHLSLGSDTGFLGLNILNNDQVSINANVDPTLSFSISNTVLNFGSFVGIAVRYADTSTGSATLPTNGQPTTLTTSTNGANGVLLSIYDQGNGTSGGLWSGSPVSELIPAAGANLVTAGSKKYGVFGKNSSGLTIDPGFTSSGATAISTSLQNFATSSGPVINATVDLALVAAVDTTTKAGIYSDSLTIICTGRY